VDMTAGIADALACAHHARMVHRDVKPENILVAHEGYAKLVDFGVAKLLGPEDELKTRTIHEFETQAGVVVGTLPYMSPEQLTGKSVDGRSDIYSFGVVLYELLGKQRPFSGKSAAELREAILHARPRPVSELRPETPYELRLAVEKALEPDPADRYHAMREMVTDLKRAQRSRAEEATPARAKLPARRLWWVLGVAIVLLVLAICMWRFGREVPSENPLANAQITRLTDFESTELDASISADGKFVGFLSDRAGQFDAWVTQVGSGEFVNLTKGRFTGLVHEQTRSVGFSGDGTHVWFKVTEVARGRMGAALGTWLVPTMGGVPRLFLERGMAAVWSPDLKHVAYFESTPGDPIFVADGNGSNAKRIFLDKPGQHCHFITWSPDGRFLYFVRGLPNYETDIWRLRVTGGEPERITFHESKVTSPALMDEGTLIYCATAEDGSGPWLYGMNLKQRAARRLSIGLEQYISVASSGEGRRLAAAVSNPSANLWTVPISREIAEEAAVSRVSMPSVRASVPVFGPDYLLYLSSKGGAEGLWRLKDSNAAELWSPSPGSRITAAPAIAADGRRICFSIRREKQTRLHVMTSDGTDLRALAESLDAIGSPSWSPDGKWIVVGGDDGKGKGIFKVPMDGGPLVRLVAKPALNPVWSPDGSVIVYYEIGGGATYPVKAVTPEGQPYSLPELWVRGERDHYRFLPGRNAFVILQGEFRQQNFWLVDLDTAQTRQLTNLQHGFSNRCFDISRDGQRIVFDRVRENSDIVLIELPMRMDSRP